MNQEELDTFAEFVMKALRTLQLQNDELRDLIDAHEGRTGRLEKRAGYDAALRNVELKYLLDAHEERLHVLERSNMWNELEGNIEQAPSDKYAVRTADGRLCVKFIEEDTEEAGTDDTTG